MKDALLHIAVLLVLPPLLLGVIGKTKAFFGGRVGMPLLQPYFDIVKLLRKRSASSTSASFVLCAGAIFPPVTVALAATLLPMGGALAPMSFADDFVLFAYLLALGRFAAVLAALDTGSAFTGMGAAREATFAALSEPVVFLCMVALILASGSISLTGMLGVGGAGMWTLASASLVLVLVCLFVVVLAENSRIPFDDPKTHLELTMIHEAMVLEHGGPMLGLILYGQSLKLLVLGSLVVNVAVHLFGISSWGWLVFVPGLLILAVGIGVTESIMARLRLTSIPGLLIGACLLSAFGIALQVR